MNLAKLRKRRGLSQKKLAAFLGVCESTVIRWEQQKTAPNARQLTALCKALDVTPSELLTME